MTLTGQSFRQWVEFEGDDQPNLLAVLALAWSYILSARLIELQGRVGSKIIYTETTAPLYGGEEGLYGFSVDIGTVDPRKLRWFAAILAPGSGFRVTPHQEDGCSHFSPWALSLATQTPPFSIKSGEDLKMSGHTPLSSYEALQSLIDICNRQGVSSHQLYAALGTALLFPTHNYLKVDPALPHPTASNGRLSSAKSCCEDSDQLFSDLPYYITLSCGGDVINSTLCGVFWDPQVPSNLASPWLQPLMDLKGRKDMQSAPGHYVEVLALICARRAPNVVFLSIGAAISGLMSHILEQVNTAQPPLERHAYAWTGVPQSFMDIAGEGAYYETYSEDYILRSDCWRLRKLPPLIDDDLHYRIGPFTPWEPPGRALLKNSPLRVQTHKNCDRHALAYRGSTWCFSNERRLEDDLGRDMPTPHIFQTLRPQEGNIFHGLQFLGNEDTSIDATIASFRWVLDNGEGRPSEAAYKDPWLGSIDDTEHDTMSLYSCSSASKGSQENRSSLDKSTGPIAWINQSSSMTGEREVYDSPLKRIYRSLYLRLNKAWLCLQKKKIGV
ncbi:hypothetical protein OEA41_010092 [Lepraria neglecta]|uniref:Uncharacterized protein n=1 Tax=Lepraria neglecta TaxID=209136 RepID=A0AAD9YYD9_9LECA|nr:hypothetical protein OEA41_010092 [Lepraria neglecta]